VGAPSLAAVALLLFFSPIYSYPYVAWLLPWAAIAFAEGRRSLAFAGFAVVALTAVVFTLIQVSTNRGSLQIYLVIIARDLLTGAIPLAFMLRSARVKSRAAVPVPQAG
jgi:hypothetical protein